MQPGNPVESKCPNPRSDRPWHPPRVCGCKPLCTICGWPKHMGIHMGVQGHDGKDIPGMVWGHEYTTVPQDVHAAGNNQGEKR